MQRTSTSSSTLNFGFLHSCEFNEGASRKPNRKKSKQGFKRMMQLELFKPRK